MSLQYRLGYECLGPVMRFFCFRLRLIEQFKGPTPLLFLSRGGLRLHYFYENYLQANKLAPIAPRHDFYISRMASFRALLARGSTYAAQEIAKEYAFQPSSIVMKYFLPEPLHSAWEIALKQTCAGSDTPVTADYLLELTSNAAPHGVLFQSHLKKQLELISEYFATLIADQDEAILIDTGWSGSIFRALQDLFPHTSLTAAFLGRSNYGKPAPSWFNSITGLVMQNEQYTPSSPQSSLVFHRHLIEGLCEPAWPSVQYFERSVSRIAPDCGVMPEALKAPQNDEDLCQAIFDFIAAEPASSPERVIYDHQVGMIKLARLITYPSSDEARALGMPPRSADFGRKLLVPVLLPKSVGGSRFSRVKQSLWWQGQAALEYGIFRKPVQFAITWKESYRGLLEPLKRFVAQWAGARRISTHT